jgi:hypothetical protein
MHNKQCAVQAVNNVEFSAENFVSLAERYLKVNLLKQPRAIATTHFVFHHQNNL